MEGRSHLLVGLTAGVVFDGLYHLSGEPLTAVKTVTLALLARKAIYYFAVGFGALLPDIDNARSTLGRKFGVISREIQHLAGHRTLFHSLLGLALGSLIALGVGQVVNNVLIQHGLILSSTVISASYLVFFGVLFGCAMHIAADALTQGGVPLFWPYKKRYGFPPSPKMRFRTGTWPEFAIVWTFMIVVVLCIWQAIIPV